MSFFVSELDEHHVAGVGVVKRCGQQWTITSGLLRWTMMKIGHVFTKQCFCGLNVEPLAVAKRPCCSLQLSLIASAV